MTCEKCEAGTHPFRCITCEHPGMLDTYKAGSPEEIAGAISILKLCNDCAAELQKALDAKEKQEIEQTVA